MMADPDPGGSLRLPFAVIVMDPFYLTLEVGRSIDG